jgi:hypothetical protein
MLKHLLKRRIAAFGAHYGYDVSYLTELLATDIDAFRRFFRVQGLSRYRKGLPAEQHFAAAFRAVLAEDCGPCAQLTVDMALEGGVDPGAVKAIVERDTARLTPDTRLVLDYTDLVLARDPRADDLRPQILERWGSRGLVTIAFAITASRMYPTLKYALGHGHACARIVVNDASIVPASLVQPGYAAT